MKAWKIFLSVGITVFILGIIIFIIGLSMNGWKTTVEYTMYTFNAEDDNNSLDLSLSTGGMNVEFYDGDKVQVDYPSSYPYGYEVYERDGSVFVKPTKTFFLWFGWRNIPDVTVKIPKDKKMYLKLSVSAGTATVADGEYDGVNFDLSAGKIVAHGMKTQSIRADISAGYLSMDKLDSKQITVKLSAGAADIKCAYSEKVTANVSAGSINMWLAGAKSDYSITVDKSAGSCNVGNQSGILSYKRIDIDISAGTVNAYFPLT